MPLEAIEPRRLYRQIADQLRQLIESGEYPVGSRLPAERELADTLGVSRPTVREALIALEVEGRLSIRVGSGIYVTAQQPGVAHAAQPARSRARSRCCARARSSRARWRRRRRGRRPPADIARIDAILAEVAAEPVAAQATGSRSTGASIVAIVATLGNVVLLTRIVGELFDQRINPYFERLARHVESDATWRVAHQEHVAIRDAIAARDPARRRAAMHEHLKRLAPALLRATSARVADGRRGQCASRGSTVAAHSAKTA